MAKFRFTPYLAAKVAKPAKATVNSGSQVKSGLLNFAKPEDEKQENQKTLAEDPRFSSDDTLKVEKLTRCLHGLPCPSIYVKDDRQVCKNNQQPIYEMDLCPIGKWF